MGSFLVAGAACALFGYAALMCLLGALSTVDHARYAVISRKWGDVIGYIVVAVIAGAGAIALAAMAISTIVAGAFPPHS